MQPVSPQTLNDFMVFFSGNDKAHGSHIYTEEKKENGKREGKSWTEKSPPLEKDYQAHLSGTKGLGIIPINHSGMVKFSVIDVDDYTNKTDTYVHLLYSNNMPLVPFRSKSGGLHLYLFYKHEIPAAKAIDTMKKFIALLSLDKKTEIFPKQKKLREGDEGNWINLPYFAKGAAFNGNMKSGIEDVTGRILELEEALQRIKQSTVAVEQLDVFFEALPLQDAPPCLQTIYMTGDTTHRNNYLFNLSIYLKNKYGDDFEYKLMEANGLLNNPLPAKEISATIAKNKGKDYTYTCSQEPICSLCNKSECMKRDFGVEGDKISKLNFEDFVQYKTDPPYYEWKVNGQFLKFFKELDIINQQKFRELCMQKLHVLPNRLKDNSWTRIVNGALSNITIQEVDPEDDISPGAMFRDYLAEFLTKRAMAASKEQVLIDRVYVDKELDSYVFKAKDLMRFLIHTKQFRIYGQTEIQDKLRSMGGVPKKYYIDKHRGAIRVWALPLNALENYVEEPNIDNFNIDFGEEFDDKPY